MFFKFKPYAYPKDGEVLWRNEKEEYSRYSDSVSEFDNHTIFVSDKDVARYLRQHMHWWDRLDYHFVADCAHEAFLILSGHQYEPLEKKWYFGRRYLTVWKPIKKES